VAHNCPQSPEVASKSWVYALIGAAAVILVAACWGLVQQGVARAEASVSSLKKDTEKERNRLWEKLDRMDEKLDRIQEFRQTP